MISNIIKLYNFLFLIPNQKFPDSVVDSFTSFQNTIKQNATK